MEFLKPTQGPYEVSPLNSNLVISQKTKETIAIVMSGKYNGVCFPESRAEKQDNAKLMARSLEMYDFLKVLLEMIPKSNDTSAFGNAFNEYVDQKHTLGEKLIKLLTL